MHPRQLAAETRHPPPAANNSTRRTPYPNLAQAVYLDEFYAPAASDDLLVLKQTIALPSSAAGLAAGQYPLTIHGNDLQNIHSLNHGGMFNRAYTRLASQAAPSAPALATVLAHWRAR